MTVLDRNQVKAPVLRRKTVPVPSLGGDVIVRGLRLSELMEKRTVNDEAKVPLDGESEKKARARAGRQVVLFTLSRTVTLADGQPLYTEAEWDTFGADHPSEVLDLFNVAEELNGLKKEAVAKN